MATFTEFTVAHNAIVFPITNLFMSKLSHVWPYIWEYASASNMLEPRPYPVCVIKISSKRACIVLSLLDLRVPSYTVSFNY